MQRSHRFTLIGLGAALLIVLGVVLYIRFIYIGERDSEMGDLLSEVDQTAMLDTAGQPVSFEQYESRVRVINAWATWSPFSAEELPMLNELASEYKNKDVVFLMVNRDEPFERIDAFLATLPPLEHLTFIRDVNDSLYAASVGYTMPETLFYDYKGNLLHHKRGALTEDEARQYIEDALVGKTNR